VTSQGLSSTRVEGPLLPVTVSNGIVGVDVMSDMTLEQHMRKGFSIIVIAMLCVLVSASEAGSVT
jgi:hypothetical protein